MVIQYTFTFTIYYGTTQLVYIYIQLPEREIISTNLSLGNLSSPTTFTAAAVAATVATATETLGVIIWRRKEKRTGENCELVHDRELHLHNCYYYLHLLSRKLSARGSALLELLLDTSTTCFGLIDAKCCCSLAGRWRLAGRRFGRAPSVSPATSSWADESAHSDDELEALAPLLGLRPLNRATSTSL